MTGAVVAGVVVTGVVVTGTVVTGVVVAGTVVAGVVVAGAVVVGEVVGVPRTDATAAAGSIRPNPYSASRPGVPASMAVDSRAARTWATVSEPLAEMTSAPAAAAYGVAIEVPDIDW